MYGWVENVFAEPGDTAMAAQLSEFWAGWGDVANQPGSEAARAQLLQRGAVAADGLRTIYAGLSGQWTTTRTQVDAYVTDVNTTAEAVAQLNQTIRQQQAAGLPTNELADQRDRHLMELAKLTDATTVAREDGSVDVFVGGSSLVAGSTARSLVTTGANQMVNQAGDKVSFRWGSETGPVATVTGGRLAASLDILGEILPGYAAQMDAVAVTLASQVNAIHTTGYPMDGTDPAGVFFASSSGPMSARTIMVAVTSPRDIGAAAVAGTLDGSKAAALAAVGKSTEGPDAQYRAVVVGLGVSAQTAQRRSEIQDRVVLDVDVLRSGDAGVNLDEEMVNIITFQRAYEAASRVLTSVDEMLDVLINRTGLVGR
jgi:flagellar hook-associated protein 1 FlgK